MTEQKENTVALVGMICSIIGLVLLFTIFLSRLGVMLLALGFILGIIGLFSKPRGKARAAVLIPVFVAIVAFIAGLYIWNSVKAPAKQFTSRAAERFEDEEQFADFDEDKFEQIVNKEFSSLFNSKTSEDFEEMYNASTGNNAIEKWSYVFFGLLQEGIENSLNTYNNALTDESIQDEDNAQIDADAENETENNSDTNDEEISVSETVEIFDEDEKSDIEQILNILE